LVSLARNYNRTVVFTIHQPRSNIVALFDQLVLLAQGRLVYAGEFAKCQPYFDSIGQHCPPGFNIADYLSALARVYRWCYLLISYAVDLTASVEKNSKGSGNSSTGVLSPTGDVTASASLRDEERALSPPRHELRLLSGGQSSSSADDETELQVRRDEGGNGSGESFLRRKTSQLLEVVSLSTAHGGDSGPPVMPHIASLVDAYAAGDVAAAVRADILAVAQPAQGPEGSEELPDVAVESTLLRGRKRATWATQFRILSGRAFKNMYRDPALLTFQYSASIAAARKRSQTLLAHLIVEYRISMAPQCFVDCSIITCLMILADSKIDWVRVPQLLLVGAGLTLHLQAFSSSLWHCLASRACRVLACSRMSGSFS
jgi:ABC-2 type transporter